MEKGEYEIFKIINILYTMLWLKEEERKRNNKTNRS